MYFPIRLVGRRGQRVLLRLFSELCGLQVTVCQMKTPTEWYGRQVLHWDSMPESLKVIIAVCAIELALLGTLAIWFQLPGWVAG